jgi:glycosyltransferase involved in cell wall biosynthesis
MSTQVAAIPAGTRPKRVVIDARMVEPYPHGFGRYVSLMAKGLQEIPRSYKISFIVQRGFSAFSCASHFEGFDLIEGKSPFLSASEWIEIPKLLKKSGADLYHSPSFSSLIWSPCPWIQTVHDLNHLHYGGKLKRAYYRLILKRFACSAKRLLSVSEFSRQEIAEWTGRSQEDIEIVTNALDPALTDGVGPSEEVIQEVLKRNRLEAKKYFLCISNPKVHKNVGTLVDAYRAYGGRRDQDWPLVLNLTDYMGTPGVRSLGLLTDSEVRVLISQAGAVLFPSLYEGFGLPPLEAAVLGAPVAVSRILPHQESLRELRDAEVTWVYPRDIGAWSEVMRQAQTDGLPRPSAGAIDRLKAQFHYQRLGSHMDRIYRDVLGIRT